MQDVDTPKKAVKSRKSFSNPANDQCRFCPFKFSVKYGKFGKPSWENLFKISGNTEYNDKTSLAKLCHDLGFPLEKSSQLSERICKPCGRSLRRTHAFHRQLRDAIEFERNQNKENEEVDEEEDDSCVLEEQRFKRSLPTTISPERRSSQKQKSFKSSPKEKESIPAGARKSLSFGDRAVADQCLSGLNVDDLNIKTTTQGKISTQVKVLILYPSKDVEVTSKFSDESKTVILNIVRKKWQTVANAVFKHPQIKTELLKPLQKATGKEFTDYCKSNKSILLAKSPKEIAEFSSKKLLKEINDACPYWSASIKGASGVEFSENAASPAAKINALALASATVARARNQRMSALAYRMSTILFHSGAKREDIDRLNKLGVCMSPDSTVDFQRQMGVSCKSKVMEWKSEIEREKLALLFLEEVKCKLPDDTNMVDFAKDVVGSYDHFNEAIYEYCKSLLGCIAKDGVFTTQVLASGINQLKATPLPEYKIVGDNIDLMVHARIQSPQYTNRSLHWTQQNAVQHRAVRPTLDTTSPRKPMDDVELGDLLPGRDVQENLVHRWAVIVSRVVTKYLDKLKPLRDVVIHHIDHEYTKEMAEKSESCSLGVEFLNPNVAGDMAQLLIKNQQMYVPSVKKDDKICILEGIAFHGDQLFEERARNTQWTYQLGDDPFDRLEGIDTEFADWHAKYNLYMLEHSIFVKESSSKEIGTTRASINRTAKTNAAKGVENHYNEYKEFHKCEVEGHICAAFMQMYGMKDMGGSPSCSVPDKGMSKDKRRRWLLDLCIAFVEKYVVERERVQPLVEQVQELEMCGQNRFPCRAGCEKTYAYHSGRVKHEVDVHGSVYSPFRTDERDPYGYFYCRAGCGLVYSTTAIRNKHEVNLHPDLSLPVPEIEDQATSSTEDYLFNYHRSKLVMGLTLFEFDDAIKEGDGERLHDLYKFVLLIYKVNGKTKYSYVILLYLVKLAGLLSEKGSHDLKWNRFFNKHGGRGNNIPLDLRMEQLNKIVKSMWKSLGSNINEASAERVANTVEPVELIIDGIDCDCEKKTSIGHRVDGNPAVAVEQVTKDLVRIAAFEFQPGRLGHPTFLDFPPNLLKQLDYRDLHAWMKEHMKLWETVYKLRSS